MTVVTDKDGNALCPVCGHNDVGAWADDGEADLADWWQCEKFSGGCGATGAVIHHPDGDATYVVAGEMWREREHLVEPRWFVCGFDKRFVYIKDSDTPEKLRNMRQRGELYPVKRASFGAEWVRVEEAS